MCIPEFRRIDSSSFNFQPRLARWCHRQTRRDQLSRWELTSLALLQALIGHLECSAPPKKMQTSVLGENIIEHHMSNLFKFSKLQHCRLGHTFSGASRLQLRPGILHSLTIHTADPSAASFSTVDNGLTVPALGVVTEDNGTLFCGTLWRCFQTSAVQKLIRNWSHQGKSWSHPSTFQEMVRKSPCGLQMHGCAIRSLFLGTVPAVTNHSTPSPFWFVLDKLFVTHTLIPSCARLRSLHSAFHRFALGWTSTKRQRIEVKVKRVKRL